MFLQSSVTVDLLATVILCSTVAICSVLVYNILLSLLSCLQDVRPSHAQDYASNRATLQRSLVHYNAQFVDALERFVRDIDERRGQRLRDLKKLPPLISYDEHVRRLSSFYNGDNDECVICLEPFAEGESCQVFPVCNHIFHTNCIDIWLKNRPTCPVCRNCILEV